MERVNTNGTSLRGHFQMPYAKLVEAIGEPNDISDGYKTDVEWSFQRNGVVATVYNWKNGPNYTGSGRIEDLTDWNIGGHDGRAVELIRALMKGEDYKGYDHKAYDDLDYHTPESDSVYWRSADLSE